jgi:NodT family efflux transporter outer membrane factor (OMF) lipoprotein
METSMTSGPAVKGIKGFLPLLVLVVGMVSCTTTPPEVEPLVQVPEQFTASGELPLPEKWWQSFDDPELHRLIEEALADNLNLQSAWDRLDQAEAIARREGAALKPTLDVLAGASRTGTRRELSTGSKDTDYFNEYSLGVQAGYEVDLWGRIRSNRDAAALDARASAEDLQAVAITLSAQVAMTWYQLVEQYGQLELLAKQLETNRKVQELVTLRFRRGKVGAADVLRQQQLVESSRGQIDRADSRAMVLKHQLAVLLGRPPMESVAGKESELLDLPPLPDSGLPLELIRRRPDIRLAYHDVLAADRRVASAIAERFPRLSLSARADTSAEEVSDLFETWLASLAANLLGPILDGGRRKAEVDRRRAMLSERLHDYSQVILDSLGEVEDALVQERKQRDFIASLVKQLEISNQVIASIRDNYIKGAADYLRVLEALVSNQSLQRNLLEARRELIEFRIDLCRALAGGFEMPRPELAALTEGQRDASREPQGPDPD